MAETEEWDVITIRIPLAKKQELFALVRDAGQTNISDVVRRGIYREMDEMKRKDAA